MKDRNFTLSINKWKNELTEQEKDALKTYTTNEYRKINSYLMYNEHSEYSDLTVLIDSALEKFILPKDICVYRAEYRDEGLTLEEIIDAFSIVNSIYYMNYISTSLSYDSAMNFLEYLKLENNVNGKTKAIYLFIEGIISKGINCGFLDEELSEIAEEEELLILRNTFFYINKIIIFDENVIKLDGRFERG